MAFCQTVLGVFHQDFRVFVGKLEKAGVFGLIKMFTKVDAIADMHAPISGPVFS